MTYSRRGAFSLVLHSHMPYVRQAGRWPHGEEWLFEALLNSYLPLAEMLERLTSEGISTGLTMGFTPILMEQLSDPSLRGGFETYVDDRIRRAVDDRARFRREGKRSFERAAESYQNRFERLRLFWAERCGGNVLQSFRRLMEAGHIEVITSAATHAYLPLLERDSSIEAQLVAGVKATQRHFGHLPEGIWLPECAYRPSRKVEVTRNESYLRPGIDEFLSPLGLKYFLVDSHAIEGGVLDGKMYGLYGQGGKPTPGDAWPTTFRSVFRPYLTRSGVAVFGRHRETGTRVWSADVGYPSHGDYREFHRRDEASGLSYWRVTGASVPLAAKAPYEVEAARICATRDAEDFVSLVERLTGRFQSEHNVRGVVVAAYDTELFGHWWHEGLYWLEETFRLLAKNHTVGPMPLGTYLKQEPPSQVIELPESSWGEGGLHKVWDNPTVAWIWPEIHAAELAMESLVSHISQGDDLERRYLKQAARELMLLEASDWPFLMSTGQAKDYAEERFREHLERFRHLARILKEGQIQAAESLESLSRYESLDNCFSQVEPLWFARQQPQPLKNPVPKFVGMP